MLGEVQSHGRSHSPDPWSEESKIQDGVSDRRECVEDNNPLGRDPHAGPEGEGRAAQRLDCGRDSAVPRGNMDGPIELCAAPSRDMCVRIPQVLHGPSDFRQKGEGPRTLGLQGMVYEGGDRGGMVAGSVARPYLFRSPMQNQRAVPRGVAST